MSDLIETLAGMALAALTVLSFSYAWATRWRVLG
jgi:hypothetical protein